MAKFVLCYIRNGKEILFPVNSVFQGLQLADCIANSDLLNDSIDFNCFDLCYYENGECGDCWESDDGMSFDDMWRSLR